MSSKSVWKYDRIKISGNRVIINRALRKGSVNIIMKIDFRIDWGYQYLYSRRHYHPVYIWDGTLECENGEIINTYRLDYPVIWFGPGQCAKETLLPSPEWKNRTKRGVSGIRIEAEVNEKTVFHLKTASAEMTFTAEDIIEKGRIEHRVGPKYLGCGIIVTKTGYLWFRGKGKPGEQVFNPKDFRLDVHNWARMELAWLEPQKSADFDVEIKETNADYCEQLIHTTMMAVPQYSGEKETQVWAEIPFELLCDGKKILEFKRHYRSHDIHMQLLEDDFKTVVLPAGRHTLSLINRHEEVCVGISRISVRSREYNHGFLNVPKWALKNEKITGQVFSIYDADIRISAGTKSIDVECKCGWNEFDVPTDEAGDISISTENYTVDIEIIDCPEEKYPVKVGYDMTVVPHDDNGFMDLLLDYTSMTRLGNYILFRSFIPVKKESLKRWGNYCKNHAIYAAACTDYDDKSLISAAGDMFHDCGMHEYPGKVYAEDPQEPYASDSMKEASEKYMAFLKKELDKIHSVFDCAAFGDASGGIRYSFLAGADFVRAETMVGHTMTLLSQVRPAAEALGKGRWGVHIAMQHGRQPYHETHLGIYFLSLMQPWIMGAEAIYEEDSLFEMFKEERQAWDDALTKGKRNMTRSFFKFVKTHPRKGKCIRNIAFLEGRYAAPFNGFICGSEQDPHYSVWGLFGNNKPSWGHGQPEKCRQILDVLMPGASTHPLRQQFEKRRFFFSGTPFGDFDCVPIESKTEYLKNYKLILNIGWNTMIKEDYDKLTEYVSAGGTLLIGLAQLSTHTKRNFLEKMEDLALINNDYIEKLCGIRVIGKGKRYSGAWNCKDREKMPQPHLSAAYSDSSEEDGEAYLAKVDLTNAEVAAWDFECGEPMLVKHKIGKGYVYTFTIWAYPGHEKFQQFAASWVEKLAGENMSEIYVEDPSKEVFRTVWENGKDMEIKMLNTDWSTAGNVKHVNVVYKDIRIPIDIKERALVVFSTRTMQTETYMLE